MSNLKTAIMLPLALSLGAAEPKSFLSGVKFSGLMDSYFSINDNKPASKINKLRNFDVKDRKLDMSYGRFSIERAAEPFGFRVDAGLGRTADILHGGELAHKNFKYIQQFYASYKVKQLRGVQFDFGKFFTSAGAEVTETHLNWNYSRSLLYANGPYYHFGLRASVPVTKRFTAGMQVVNGWNNIKDNNAANTLGFTTALTLGKLSWYNTFLTGPEKTGTTAGRRNFYDTVVALNPHSRASFLFNFDYGTDERIGGGKDTFWGGAVSARFPITKWFALSPRWEYYSDRDAFITGTPQLIREFTGTAEIKISSHSVVRAEYRRDWSNAPFFDRGNLLMVYPNQETFLIGITSYYSRGN